jgi:hypothetical protein
MVDTPSGMIVHFYRETYKGVIKLVEDLSEVQIGWRPTPTAISIGFSLWQLARLADSFQEFFGRGGGLWKEEELAVRWGLDPSTIDYEETGMETDHTADLRLCLSLPGKEELLDYARRAFEGVERGMGGMDEEEFWKPLEGMTGGSNISIGQLILTHLTNANRHFGQIECLLRAQRFRGGEK